jgi:hypothetical protein
MHSKLTRLITLLAILVCLPLQGLAAVAMPACQTHGQQMAMHADADRAQASDDCDHDDVKRSVDCDHHHDKTHQSKSSPCDKCFSCYLSATQAVLPQLLAVDAIGVAVKIAAPQSGMSDALPSSLYHPPRTTFA